MKLPRIVRGHCPHCNTHQDLEIERVKSRPRSELKAGQRRYRRAMKGYGGFPRPKPEGEKPTKRINIRYRCKACGKAHHRPTFRAKRLELVEV